MKNWKRGLGLLLALMLAAGSVGNWAVPASASEETAATETTQTTEITETTEPVVTEPAETEPLLPEDIPVDEAHFPDAIFRGVVLETCDENSDGQLSPEEIAGVTRLDVSGMAIATLEGIENFPGLTHLECQNNSLTALDLTGNPALRELRCYQNALTDLNVSGCPELTRLFCGKNQLNALNLTKNAQLTLVQCQENNLTALDLSGCPQLDFLVCADNQLPFVDLTANQLLTEVQAEGNIAFFETGTLDLSAIPGFDPARASDWENAVMDGSVLTTEPRAERLRFTYDLDGKGTRAVFTWQLPRTEGVPIDQRSFPDDNFRLLVSHELDTTPDGILTAEEQAAVTRIVAENYEIESLEGLALFTGLRELLCGNNGLAFVDVSENPQLTTLAADGNEASMEGNWDRTVDLSAIPGFDPARASGWDGGREEAGVLTVLEGTDTVRFTYDVDGTAGDKTALFTWHLRFPQRPEGVAVDETTFPDDIFRAWVLENCDRDGNGVLSPEETNAVRSLDVSGAGIASLAGAECFEKLETLNCGDNLLTELDPGLWRELKNLDCSFNSITALDLSGSNMLETLNCGSNQLTTLDLSDCPELMTLNCRKNDLDALDMTRNDRLMILNCGENRLEALDLRKCPNLTDLNCDYNRLTSLELPESGNLKTLSCNFNSLTQLDVSGQKELRWLFLGGNRVESLDLSGHHDLEKLDCANNALTALDLSACPVLDRLICGGNDLSQLVINQLVDLELDRGLPVTEAETPVEVPQETSPQEEALSEEPCAHTFGPWIERVQPTCTETGALAHMDCTFCGRHFDRNRRELPELTLPTEPSRHINTEKVPRTEPTCTEDGFTAGIYCRDCGAYISGHTLLPARHTLTAWIREVKPTNGHPGVLAHMDCKVCGRHFDADGRELTDLAIPATG